MVCHALLVGGVGKHEDERGILMYTTRDCYVDDTFTHYFCMKVSLFSIALTVTLVNLSVKAINCEAHRLATSGVL